MRLSSCKHAADAAIGFSGLPGAGYPRRLSAPGSPLDLKRPVAFSRLFADYAWEERPAGGAPWESALVGSRGRPSAVCRRRENQDGARGILGARGSVGARGMEPSQEERLAEALEAEADGRSRTGGLLGWRGGGGGTFGGDRARRVTSVAKSSFTSICPPPRSSGRKGLVNRTGG